MYEISIPASIFYIPTLKEGGGLQHPAYSTVVDKFTHWLLLALIVLFLA